MRHLDYILFTRAGDGRWPRYQAKSLACPGCGDRPSLSIATERLTCLNNDSGVQLRTLA